MANKSVGLLNIVFGADLRGFDKAMKKAQKRLKEFSTWSKRTGANLSQNVTLPILLAAGASVKMASDMEESTNKVRVAFGKSSAEIENFANTTLEAFGIAKADALEMSSLFGDMGTALGFSQGEAAGMSKTLVGLAGDLSSFKNIGVAEAQTALVGIFTGETESLKKLGIMTTEATLKNSDYFLSLNKTWKELTNNEKIMVRYNAVMEQTANAQGDFARTSDGFANQLRVLQGNFKDLGAELGSILLPTAVKIIEKIKDWIVKFRELDDGTKEFIVKAALLAAAVGPILMFMGQMSTGVSALIPIIGALGGAFTRLSAVMLANPYLAAAAALLAIGVAIYSVISNANEFADSMAAVNDVNLQAEKSIVSQKLAVEGLAGVLKDENATLEDKEKALSELNRIAPEYYGELSAAQTDIQALDSATKDYIGTLRAQARALAAQEKMVEIEKKLLEEETKLTEQRTLAQDIAFTQASDGSFIEKSLTHLNVITGVIEKAFTGDTGYDKTLTRISDLKKQSEELGKVITDLPKTEPIVVPDRPKRPKPPKPTGDGTTTPSFTGEVLSMPIIQLVKLEPIKDEESLFGDMATNEFMRLNNEMEEEWESTTKTLEEQADYTTGILIEDFTDAVDKIKKVMGSLSGVFSAIGDKESVEFDMWVERQEERKDILDEEMENEFARVEEKGFNEKREAEEKALVEEEYAQKKAEIDARIETKERALKKKQAQRDKAMKIASAIMSTAEAVAANIAMPPLAALIGILGAIQVGVIASTPIPFAQGGLVSGATLGLLGEGSGTSAFNPEVVSPLDKLMGMMGATDVDVHGRIEGNNIVLVSDKAEISRQRFI